MFYKIWIFSLIISTIYTIAISVLLDNKFCTSKFEDILLFIAHKLFFYVVISLIILTVIGSYVMLFKLM